MLDEWTSRLLWLDPNDNELALRFHYDTLFINNIQTIRASVVTLFTVRAGARTITLVQKLAVGSSQCVHLEQ